MARTYVASLPGGTATTTIQMQSKATLKMACFAIVSAAAGTVELSLNAASQIATAQPPSDVLARVRVNGAAGYQWAEFPLSQSVTPFQNVYIHQTGAGNVGEATLMT